MHTKPSANNSFQYLIVSIAVMLLLSNVTKMNAQRHRTGQPRAGLSLDEEARLEADKYWRRVLTKCGDSFYTKSYVEGDQDRLSPSMRGYWIFQMKDISISTQGQARPEVKLSRADILNGAKAPRVGEGTEWSGTTTLSVAVARTGHHENEDPEQKLTWNKWAENSRVIVNVEKTDGTWHFYRVGTFGGPQGLLERVACSFIEDANKFETSSAPYFDKQGFFHVPAKHSGWSSLGKGPLTISLPKDDIDASVIQIEDGDRFGTGLFGRSGTYGRSDFLVPGLPIGALVIKIGPYGQPELLHWDESQERNTMPVDTTEEVFIGVNDSVYSDNKGEFRLVVKRGVNLGPIAKSNTCESQIAKGPTTGFEFSSQFSWYIQTKETVFDTGIEISRTFNVGIIKEGGARWNDFSLEPSPGRDSRSYNRILVIRNPTGQCLRLKVLASM